jgi:hypothetical protein
MIGQRLVCLDLSPEVLGVVEVRANVVTTWGSRRLAAYQSDGLPSPASLAGALRELLTAAGVGARRARLTLPDAATVSRTLVLPPMRDRDLTRAMRYEAERHLPFPIGQARWSWDLLERRVDAVIVYLVATWGDVADRWAEAARLAGLRPEVLEPRSLALVRALDRDQAVLLEGRGGLLHLTVVQHRRPALIDRAPWGGRDDGLERLLHRAFRHQSAAGRLPPVLLAGELEGERLPVPVPAVPVGEVLDDHLPAAPPTFRAGAHLAELGLAMRSSR